MKSRDQQLLEEAYDRVGMNVNPALSHVSVDAKKFLDKHYSQVQQTAIMLAARSPRTLEQLKAAVQKMAAPAPLTKDDINSISKYYLKQAELFVFGRSSLTEAGMPPASGANFEEELTRIKIIVANLSDDIDYLRSMVEDINGPAELPKKILEVFDKIEDKLESIVPAESDF